MKAKIDSFEKILLAIFLIATHTKLLYWADPVYENDKMIKFSYLDINEKTVQAMILAFLFGTITVYILAKKEETRLFKAFVITIAILDGLVVQWLYNELFPEQIKIALVSTHYTIYTIFIILVFGFSSKHRLHDANYAIAPQKNDNNDNTYNAIISKKSRNIDKIKELLEEGKKPDEIAVILGINPSTVYRNIKKIEGGKL